MTHLQEKKIPQYATNVGGFCLFHGVWVGCYQTCTGNSHHLQGPGQPQPPTETTATEIQGKSLHTIQHAARTMLLISTLTGDKH